MVGKLITIKLNRLRANMHKRNDEILFDFQQPIENQFDYKIQPYIEFDQARYWGLYNRLQY